MIVNLNLQRILTVTLLTVFSLSVATAQVKKSTTVKPAKARQAQTVKQPTAEELNDLAAKYFHGYDGMDMNKEKAFELWLQSAKMGNAWGQAYSADNEKLTDEERISWARKSAEQGCYYGMEVLAFAYVLGDLGLPIDDVQANYWFKRAADTGVDNGLYWYGLRLLTGKIPGNKDENTKKALEYWEKAAEQNYARAIFDLANGYHNGFFSFEGSEYPFPKNREKYLYYMRKAAELEDVAAMYDLAWNLNDERQTDIYDAEQAYTWFLKVLEKSKPGELVYGESCFQLACIEIDNHNDYSKMIEWYRKGAEAQDPSCMFFLAEEIRYNNLPPAYEAEDQTLYTKIEDLTDKELGNWFKIRDWAKAENAGQIVFTILRMVLKEGVEPVGGKKSLKELEQVKYLKEQAEMGNCRAQAYYGGMLIPGYKVIGVKRDVKLGRKYIREALEQGDNVGKIQARIFENAFHEPV